MSRDIKGTSLNELNDGLERAVRRCKSQLTSAIADAERNAINSAICISNDNIRRSQQQMQAKINQVSTDLSGRIENSQRQIGARIDEQSRRFTQEIQNLDRKHVKALNELSNKVAESIEEQVSRLDKNIGILNKSLNEVSRSMNDLASRTNERFRQQQNQISSIQRDIKSIFERQQSDTNSKLLAAGAALALLDAIRERTDVARFAPRQMLDSIALKEDRLRNIGNNPDSCTITDVNNLIDEALGMENEAIRRRSEWEPLHKAALASAMAVLSLLEKSESIKVASLYDDGMEEELQTDYWTHGAYSRIMQEIKTLKEQIENAPAEISVIKNLQNKVDELQHQAEHLIIEAAELGTLSEQRIIVSNDVLNAMVNQGWELKGDPDYMGGEEESDWREGTFAILYKPNTGEEVSILVLPEEKNGKIGNQIIFHRNDDLLESAGAFQSRMEEIKREIEKSGYKLGDLHEPEHGDGKVELLRDRNSMKRKGASTKLRETLSGH